MSAGTPGIPTGSDGDGLVDQACLATIIRTWCMSWMASPTITSTVGDGACVKNGCGKCNSGGGPVGGGRVPLDRGRVDGGSLGGWVTKGSLGGRIQ